MVLENVPVKHKTFGNGKVVWMDQAKKYLRVAFNLGEKQFVFPVLRLHSLCLGGYGSVSVRYVPGGDLRGNLRCSLPHHRLFRQGDYPLHSAGCGGF